jgi:putative ABC transport system permease protein
VSVFALIGLALQSLRSHVGRALLTMLGVVIGVASVVVMVAIGEGAQAEIAARIQGLGANLVVVTPGSGTPGGVSGGAASMDSLTLEDAALLARESQLLAVVSPVIFSRGNAVAGRNNWRTVLYGVDVSYAEIRAWTVETGRFLEEDDVRASRKVCLLGASVAAALFPGEDAAGQRIRLRGVPLQVVGTLQKKGQTADGNDQDDVIIAPYTTVRSRLAGRQFIGQILGSAWSEADLVGAQAEVKQILRESHRLSAAEPDDFEVRDQAALAAAASSTTEVMTTLLLAIASVSLLVGGIGIMNIMLVSVTERTREIGIRRAFGASQRDVLGQFLVESIVLSGLGGVVGAAFGVGATAVVAGVTGWSTVVTPGTLGVAMAFSIGVGVFFGWVPARRAAALDIVDALRTA